MRSVGSIRGSTGTITMRKHLVEVNASKSSAPGTFVIREDVQASRMYLLPRCRSH